MDILSDLVGLLTAIISFCIWGKMARERARLSERISIRLVLPGGERKALPYKISRQSLTRAEVAGVLGLLKTKNPGARYSVEYLGSTEFFETILNCQSGSLNVVEIPLTGKEVEQFSF